jgi:hypothetical protein
MKRFRRLQNKIKVAGFYLFFIKKKESSPTTPRNRAAARTNNHTIPEDELNDFYAGSSFPRKVLRIIVSKLKS